MKMVREIAAGAVESFRETLPSSEAEAGTWIAGFAWAMVLHWAMLSLTTWLWWKAQTVTP